MKQSNLIIKKCGDRKKYLLPWGDWHVGHKTCDLEKIKKWIPWILKEKVWVIGMGDYLEIATKTSPGASVYEQTLGLEKQKEIVLSILKPIADAGLLLGLLTGNHEYRCYKETGNDVVSDMCKILRVPYLGWSCFSYLIVGKQHYIVYSTHGSSSAKMTQTKLKTVIDLSHSFSADMYLMGHLHELAQFATLQKRVNTRSKKIETKKRYFVLTGHYVRYEGSYAEMMNLQPSKLGSPRIRLDGDEYDIHISI